MAEKRARRNLDFDLQHHGDEVIIVSNDDDTITLKIKIQTGQSEFRSILFTAETQTQVERLLPGILKGLVRG